MKEQDMWLALVILVIVGISLLVMNLLARRRGYGIPGRTSVRCSQGHRFETTWIEGGSLRAVRLGPWTRYQRCPVCGRGRIVHPIREEGSGDAGRVGLDGSG
jgi:hypothetical protein